MAGIDNFQQSGLNISLATLLKATHTPTKLRPAASDALSTLNIAMTKDMEPLRISFKRTAAAGEYACDAGMETRE